MQYTLDWVRQEVARLQGEGAGNIRVHPNGFIQVDLLATEESWHASHHKGHSGATLRLHIWNPPDHVLPRQGTVNELHTHVFDMHSTIVRGKMNQRIYTFAVGSEWHSHRDLDKVLKGPVGGPELFKLYKAVYAKSSDSRLEDTGVPGVVVSNFDWSVHEGQDYFQPAFTFHDSDPEGCTVTIMEKTRVYDGDAYVLVPVAIEPDNSYDRASASTPEYLWSAVEAAVA